MRDTKKPRINRIHHTMHRFSLGSWGEKKSLATFQGFGKGRKRKKEFIRCMLDVRCHFVVNMKSILKHSFVGIIR